MGCFDNLIGIRAKCGDADTATSGLWIEDLHGISVNAANSTITPDYETGLSLIEEKISFAAKVIAEEVYQNIQGKISAVSLLENDTIGYYKDNLPVLDAEAGYLRGFRFKIENSPYAEAFISAIRFQPQVAGTYAIKVIDLITGIELDSKNITTTANNEVAEVYLNKSYSMYKGRLNLFFGVASTVATYKTGLHSTSKYCSSCGGWPSYRNRGVEVRGAKISTSGTYIESNLSSLNHTSGLSIDYSVGCSMTSFLCSIANRLAYPILYKTGELLCAEMMYSRRLNSVISLYGKETAELRAEFENEYLRSINALLGNMKLPNDVCFRCNPKIRTVTQVP